MATETESLDDRASHIRGVTVTTVAALAGVAAALLSSALTAEAATISAAAADDTALYVLAGAILVQFPVLRLLGVDVEDFSTKDYLYVAFMTFALWFVSWGILLSSGTTVVL